MWYRTQSRMPYYRDSDFRQSLINSIKMDFGDIPVDITLLEWCGIIDIFCENPNKLDMKLFSDIRYATDRGMVDPRIIV